MKERLFLFFKYALFWYLFFVFSRLLFLFYHFKESRVLPLFDWLRIFGYGFKLDISTTGYIMILPALFIIFTCFFNGKLLYWLMNIYTLIVLTALVILTLADLELYSFWGFRLDTTPLLYMDNKQAMFASVSVVSVLLSVVLIAVLVFLAYRIYLNWIAAKIKNIRYNYQSGMLFPVIAAALFIPIRGGFDVAAVNVSTAFFHTNQFANQAAINCIWNVGFSLSEMNDAGKRFDFMKQKEAEKIFDSLYIDKGETNFILKTKNPNIIIIALESFTSKGIEVLGGRKGITPCINELVHEGILFDHFYASGDRTDKAMVALIAAYPAQPTTNIIKFPHKLKNLPFITSGLKNRNYHSAYYYGGSIDFANYRTLLNMAGFEKIITKDDFNKHANDSKWGAFDEYVFDRLLEDTPDGENHFFKFLFTLTSHPPYTIPIQPLLKGSDDDSKFLSSMNYTDRCIGDFIKKAKTKKWWANTLIILVADHGVNLPGNTANHEAIKFTIPMLWLGGALAVQDTVVEKYASQTDLLKTLFCQLDIPFENKFGKNIFSSGSRSFAFYTFNNGFGYVTDKYTMIYNNITGNFIQKSGKYKQADSNPCKAYMQVLSEDFRLK